MRDHEYIAKMQAKNDLAWKSSEKFLYYSYKNDSYIIPTAVACFLIFFVKGGIIGVFMILAFVRFLCWKNNHELDTDPNVRKRREEAKEYRRRKGEDV